MRIATLAALLLVAVAWPVFAGPQESLIPLADYTTPKAKDLAVAHQAELLKLSEHIYHCLPWLAAVKKGIGFPHPKGADGDDRYLSVWVNIDQTEDPRFEAMPLQQRASAMFSRYGVHLLKRMSQRYPEIESDTNVQGFMVVLSWLKPGSLNLPQPITETIALFVDKATLREFLTHRMGASDFTERAKYNVFDGKTLVGHVPLEVWEDDFNSTYKLKGYEVEKGQQC